MPTEAVMNDENNLFRFLIERLLIFDWLDLMQFKITQSKIFKQALNSFIVALCIIALKTSARLVLYLFE